MATEHYLGGAPTYTAGVVTAEVHTDAFEAARLRNAQLIGEIALGSTVRIEMPERSKASIDTRIRLAQEGDAEALKSLEIDAKTEIIEMICKGGAVMTVEAQMNADGELQQFGLGTYDRQKNTLQYYPNQSTQLRDNTMAEGQNGFMIEDLYRKGAMRDRQLIEFSLILDNVATSKELVDYGYYLNEMIGIIRTTRIDEEGKATITSALVGGVDHMELADIGQGHTTEQAEALRHDASLMTRFDIATIRRMYDLFGYSGAYDMSTTELLATPLLVPKAYDALDFVRLYDEIATDIIGSETFFGLTDLRIEYADRSTLDRDAYETHARCSQERQAMLADVSKAVLTELLSRSHEATDALAASKLLRSIAKNKAVEYVVRDTIIDTAIFGSEAQVFIDQAQVLYAQGQLAAARIMTSQAKQVARPSGCPLDSRRIHDDPTDPTSPSRDPLGLEKQSKENQKKKPKIEYKLGRCRVKSCLTRPKKSSDQKKLTAWVGPCSVCKGCQAKFDSGKDPTTEYVRPDTPETPSFWLAVPAPAEAHAKKPRVAFAE